jgi:hypothetical protein
VAEHITINGVEYPLMEEGTTPAWQTAEQGQEIRWSRDFGFLGGMGAFTERRPDDYLFSNGIDTTTYPFLRLPPKRIDLGAAKLGQNGQLPVYMFRAQSNYNWVYVANGRYVYKFREDGSDLIYENLKTFASGAVCGRPALFKGTWYLPLGGAVFAKTLDTIASSGDDSWSDAGAGYYALHYAVVNHSGTTKLAVAGGPDFTTALPPGNEVGYSADGTVPPSSFEANDSSIPISDLIGGNELIVIDASAVFRMDADGYVVKDIDFVGRHPNISAFPGSNSFMHGPYLYWPHISGLYRKVGQNAQPIGPDADPQWVNRTLDGFTPLQQGSNSTIMWSSVVVYGQWLYATYGRSLFAGLLNEDGTVRWHGVVYQASTASEVRCHITDGPVLWLTEAGAVRRFALDTDGSMRAIDGNRGEASTSYQFWGPVIDGGPRLASKNKQWRKIGVELEGDWSAWRPLQLAAHMDGATTSTNVGSTFYVTGATEQSWTVGTTDTARYIIPTLKLTTTVGHVTGDPRIRRWWVEGVTPLTYAARLDLRAGTTGLRDWEDRLKKLRDLRGGAAITIIPPKKNSGFTGYVRQSLQEVWDKEKNGYIVTALLERYDWDGA